VSSGRFWENISTFALSQPTDPGATPLSGASTLVHLNFLDRDGIWLLFPFALLAGALSLRRRRLSLFQIALVVEMLVLVVVLRDVGADYNHLLDMSVLTALVVGELWGSPPGSVRARRWLTGAMTVALVVGAALAYNETIRPDIGLGARLAVGSGSDARFSTHPLRGIVAPAANVLSDPRGPTARDGSADALSPRKAAQGLDPRPAQADRRQTVRRRRADQAAATRLVPCERQLR
jgi:hypothetical protein